MTSADDGAGGVFRERRRIEEYNELNRRMFIVEETWERPTYVQDAAIGDYDRYDVVSEHDTLFDEGPDDGLDRRRRLRYRVSPLRQPGSVQYTGPDWLEVRWSHLNENARTVMTRRSTGDTLEATGIAIGVTRERARQIQKTTEKTLAAAAHFNGLSAQLETMFAGEPAVAASTVDSALPPADPAAQDVLLFSLGFRHPQSWDGDLTSWWTNDKASLGRLLETVCDLAPLSHDDFAAALNEMGLSYEPPVSTLLESDNSKLVRSQLGWHRRSRSARDLAYLYLQQEGAARTVTEVAAVTGTSEHAIRETMRREDAFAQVRPEGTWALADWRLPGSQNRYSNAEETVVEVVRELGPISLPELRHEVTQRYPVSPWRITQCLSSAMIGLTDDGRYDLAERGAKPIEDSEPKRPSTIQAQGHIVGVQLPVNHDVLRGSGIPVNRWLTWHLGLRIVPSIRTFTLNTGGEVTIKRASSNAQVSSLRTAIQSLDVVEGCKIALVLNTQTDVAKIRHICPEISCPAG